jgi:hypothetical protein
MPVAQLHQQWQDRSDISSMFEMGTGKVLSQEVAGAAGKSIADTAITDATTGSFDSQFMNMSKTFHFYFFR